MDDPIFACDKLMGNLQEIVAASTKLVQCNTNVKSVGMVRSRTRKWIAQRNYTWFIYRKSPCFENWEKYRTLRNFCTALVRADKLHAQEALARKCLANHKYLYRYVNGTRKVKQGIPHLKSLDGLSKTSKEAADILLKQFLSVAADGQSSCNPPPMSISPSPPISQLSTITFSPSKVRSVICKLKPNSAPGNDGLHPKVLIALADILCEPLACFFQNLFSAGSTPESWKYGIISPIYKTGDRSDPANYRPVTLLPILSKVMESIVSEHLISYLEENGILSSAQHGFISRHSCVTNLLFAQNDWTRAVDCGLGIDAVFLDFSKAFDRVRHDLLLHKLQNFGVTGDCLSWIKSFLSGRKISVKVNGVLSPPFDINMGVPQGSVLGPRLFLVFINDILSDIDSNLLLFADDLKIWRHVTSPTDCVDLQNDLDKLFYWSVMNFLPFNTKKCHVLRIHHTTSFQYRLNNVPLSQEAQERDLGVIVQNDLGWTANCKEANKKALKMLGLLKRAFGVFEPRVFHQLNAAYIRPHLEYAMQVCSPWLVLDKQLLEQPQRKATKLVRGHWNISYQARLLSLDVFSLSYRRIRGDLILTYRIVNNVQHPCRPLLKFSANTHLRGHRWKLAYQHSRLNCRHFYFSVRICQVWNNLPDYVVSAPSVESFKKRLDNHFSTNCYSLEW